MMKGPFPTTKTHNIISILNEKNGNKKSNR